MEVHRNTSTYEVSLRLRCHNLAFYLLLKHLRVLRGLKQNGRTMPLPRQSAHPSKLCHLSHFWTMICAVSQSVSLKHFSQDGASLES